MLKTEGVAKVHIDSWEINHFTQGISLFQLGDVETLSMLNTQLPDSHSDALIVAEYSTMPANDLALSFHHVTVAPELIVLSVRERGDADLLGVEGSITLGADSFTADQIDDQIGLTLKDLRSTSSLSPSTLLTTKEMPARSTTSDFADTPTPAPPYQYVTAHI